MKNPFLAGENIYLSPLSRDDISPEYVAWLNDEEVCKDNSHSTFPNTLEKATTYVQSLAERNDEVAFAIRRTADDSHVGNASLQHINWINRSGELAILIGDKSSWNKGIGSEAYALLIDYAFKVLNLNRISSSQTVRNEAMVKVCEKNGMRKEGILRQALFKNGVYLDAVTYSILRTEYVNR